MTTTAVLLACSCRRAAHCGALLDGSSQRALLTDPEHCPNAPLGASRGHHTQLRSQSASDAARAAPAAASAASAAAASAAAAPAPAGGPDGVL